MKVLLSILISFVGWAGVASAQTRSQVYGSQLTKQTHTAFVAMEYGWQTYESEAVGSNATATTGAYTIGGFAGEARELGVFVRVQESDTPFTLNGSGIRTEWRDLALQARIGPFYPSIITAHSEVRIKEDDITNVHMFGSGYGAGLDFHAPLTTKIVVHAKGSVIATPDAHDKEGSDVSMGRREEFDVGSSIDLTPRALDLLVGYRYRHYDLSLNEEDYSERQTIPYGGIRLGLYF